MNSALRTNPKLSALAKRYQSELGRHLKQGYGASLEPAFKMGHQAMIRGFETLDLALIHEKALLALAIGLPDSSPDARKRVMVQSSMFFAEAILPIEATHRSALEANVYLSNLNKKLSRRTTDLAASSLSLTREIARRKVLEETLRQSEHRSNELLKQSKVLQKELQSLSRRILSTQEDERKRISRELHDVIAQTLTGINLRLADLKTEARTNAKGFSRKISSTQRLVEKSVDIIHKFARELRPTVLDDLGLIPALHSFVKTFSKDTGISANLNAFAGVEKLNNDRRTVLYRVAHEALTNVARHANASRVDIRIKSLPKAVIMEISDNGQGFEPQKLLCAKSCRHLGLLGSRERVEMVGGKFTIKSAPGKGTTIQAQIPCKGGIKRRSK